MDRAYSKINMISEHVIRSAINLNHESMLPDWDKEGFMQVNGSSMSFFLYMEQIGTQESYILTVYWGCFHFYQDC